MAKLEFGNILTKLSNIFKKDVYIIQNRYCIGGKESEHENISKFICILSPLAMDLVKGVFPDEEIIFFSDIKKAKKELNKYTKTTDEIEKETRDKVIKIKNELEKEVMSINKWESFNFTEEDVNDLFIDAKAFELFDDNDKIPNVTISKTLFPMVKETNYDTLYYNVKVPDYDGDLVTLYVSYDEAWFQTFSIIKYVDL